MKPLTQQELTKATGRCAKTIQQNRPALIQAGHCIQVGARYLYLPPSIKIMKQIPETRGRPKKT